MIELQRINFFLILIWEFDIDNFEEFNVEIMNDFDCFCQEDEGVCYDLNWKSQVNDEEVMFDFWYSLQIVVNDEIFVLFQKKLFEVLVEIFVDFNVLLFNLLCIFCFWVNFNGKYVLNILYIYGYGFISGIYYVCMMNKMGDIVFYDLCIEVYMNQFFYQEGLCLLCSVSVMLQDGCFVMFLSWLLYMVKFNFDDMMCIGILFDIEYGYSVFDVVVDLLDCQVVDVVCQMFDVFVVQDVSKVMIFFVEDVCSV